MKFKELLTLVRDLETKISILTGENKTLREDFTKLKSRVGSLSRLTLEASENKPEAIHRMSGVAKGKFKPGGRSSGAFT